jgi:ribosomal protein S12 methylthiotransferase accessory factor
MEVIVVNTMHHRLEIPAFYTIIPGAHFRERATNTSVGMFSAKLIAESGNPEWAIHELEKMNDLMPGKYFIKFFLGTSLLSLNNANAALSHFEEALNLAPNREDISSIYSYIGVCLKDLDRYREAIKALEEAERYDAERTEVYNLMGFCYFKLKEHERAIDCFRKVLRLDPSSAIDYANIASNYRDMGDRVNAVRHYRLALELDPSIDFARENLEKLQGK